MRNCALDTNKCALSRGIRVLTDALKAAYCFNALALMANYIQAGVCGGMMLCLRIYLFATMSWARHEGNILVFMDPLMVVSACVAICR